jgi:hypothetical protein
MATSNELLEHCARLRAQMLDEIAACRSGGWRVMRDNEDITEPWLQEQQARADKLARLIAPHEKPPAYIYGAF